MDFKGFYLVFTLFPLLACKGQGAASKAPLQGIEGTVFLMAGNQMPAPGIKRQPPAGYATTVYVYELTNISQVVRQGASAYYSAINTRLVKAVETDSTGRFVIGLDPGQYSIFTKKGDLFFASRGDTQNNIAPVEVLPGKMTKVDCRVESDHKPVY